MEDDTPFNDTTALRSARKTYTLPSQGVTFAPGWTTTLAPHIAFGEPLPNAEFYLAVAGGGLLTGGPYYSPQIWLQDGNTPTGGVARAVRTGTAGITFGTTLAMNLDLPGGPGENYAVYSFTSADGETLEFHGFNDTGYSLLNASDDDLVFDEFEGEFTTGTTFETVFADETNSVGQWYGSESIIGALSSQIVVSGYNYTASLPVLPRDGETISYRPSDFDQTFGDGEDALWLMLPGEEETIGFLIVRKTPPEAEPDSYNAHQGETLTISASGVLQNDTDADWDTLTADLVADVSDGTLTLNSDGSFSYTSDSQFTGDDSFTYRAYDGTDYSDPVTVTISVSNGVPVGNDDFYSVHQGDSLYSVSSVLNNDTSPYSLTAELDNDVSNGTLMLYSDGTFDYTPDSEYAGYDSFTYQAYDGSDYSNTITVTIEVQNSVPIAIVDGYSVHQGDDLISAASVLANDIDNDADNLEAELIDDVSNGTLMLYSDGTFDYTPDSGFVGTDSFTYQVFDGAEYSNTVAVDIVVDNTVPEGTEDEYFVQQNGSLVGATSVLDNDDDEDPEDTLSAELVSGPSNGTLNFYEDGTFDYTPDWDFLGEDTFTYRVYDGAEYSDEITVTINVEL